MILRFIQQTRQDKTIILKDNAVKINIFPVSGFPKTRSWFNYKINY